MKNTVAHAANLDEYRILAKDSNCASVGKAPLSIESTINLAAEWSGLKLETIAARVGFDGIVGFENLPEKEQAYWADKLLSETGIGYDKLKEAFSQYGETVCPFLSVPDISFVRGMQNDSDIPSFAYIKFAQLLAKFHGCYSSEVDGIFGPKTAASWSKIRFAAKLEQTTNPPTPGEILYVATQPLAEICGTATTSQAKTMVLARYLVFLDPQLSLKIATKRMLELAELDIDRVWKRNLLDAAFERMDAETALSDVTDNSSGFYGVYWNATKPTLQEIGLTISPHNVEAYLSLAKALAFGIGTEQLPQDALYLLSKISSAPQEGYDEQTASIIEAGASEAERIQLAIQRYIIDVSPEDELEDPDQSDEYRLFLNGLSSAKQAEKYVKFVTKLLNLNPDANNESANGNSDDETKPMIVEEYVKIDDIPTIFRLAKVVTSFPEALIAFKLTANPSLKYKLGVVICEGSGESDRCSIGMYLIRTAAKEGNRDAELRMGRLYEYGTSDIAPSALTALSWYERSSKNGSAEASFAAAELLEKTTPNGSAQSKQLFRRAVDQYQNSDVSWSLIRAVQRRITDNQGFWVSQEGQIYLANLAADENARFTSENSADDTSEKPATMLADLYLCTDCGGVVDVDAAKKWYRIAAEAGDTKAPNKLANLLLRVGSTESSRKEAIEVLEGNASRSILTEDGNETDGVEGIFLSRFLLSFLSKNSGYPNDVGSETVKTNIEAICKTQANACIAVAYESARGSITPSAIRVGVAKLRELSDKELQNVPADANSRASEAYADVLAFYGDFSDSLRVFQLKKAASIDPSLNVKSSFDVTEFNSRASTLRRIVSTVLGKDHKSLPDGILELLVFLSDQGDETAKDLILAIESNTDYARPLPTNDTSLGDLEAALLKQQGRGGVSRGLVSSGRDLSQAYFAAGKRKDALKLELTALAGELQMAEIEGLKNGQFDGLMTRVCLLSRSSERIADMGYKSFATALAKSAVNSLQLARQELVGLPENLRSCFRNIVSDNYRWLADLFVTQGSYAEASHVLNLLKDFETYEFVGRDESSAGHSFDTLPTLPLESSVSDGVMSASQNLATVASLALDESRLEEKRSTLGLTAVETAELSNLQEQLATAKTIFSDRLQAIVEECEKLEKLDKSQSLDELNKLTSYLSSSAGTDVAVVRYVVLPNKLHIIVSLRGTQTARTITTIGELPFTEANLDATIVEFRRLLQDSNSDPREVGKKLYDLLVEPIIPELHDAKIRLLLIQPDRRLRYIPFAALYDGSSYLVKSFQTAILSNAALEFADVRLPATFIAGFGRSDAVEGFGSLPNVKTELSAIVNDGKSGGLIPGTIKLNEDFTRNSLVKALGFDELIGDQRGIVHIASHFSLGNTDSSSFLLLGDESRLFVKDLREDRLKFDFGRVDLLALSACETAYTNPNVDGRELQSFSEVAQKRGARSVLASLWPIADGSTAVFMHRFYESREKSQIARSEALAQTQLEFISESIQSHLITAVSDQSTKSYGATNDKAISRLSHPYYWAPYVLYGNWR